MLCKLCQIHHFLFDPVYNSSNLYVFTAFEVRAHIIPEEATKYIQEFKYSKGLPTRRISPTHTTQQIT